MCIEDRYAAYQFDACVATWGAIVENALQEREKVGSGANAVWRNVYTLEQLLDPKFRLPLKPLPLRRQPARLEPESPVNNGRAIVGTLRSWAQMFRGHGVKVFKAQ